MNIYRYVWNNPLSFTDPSGLNAIETTLLAANRAQSIGTPIYQVGKGIGCIFGGIGSLFEALNENEGQIVDVQLDLVQTCGAQVVTDVAPAFNSDDPVGELVKKYAVASFRLKLEEEISAALTASTPGIVIFPTSSPAYPSTWKNVPFYPF